MKSTYSFYLERGGIAWAVEGFDLCTCL